MIEDRWKAGHQYRYIMVKQRVGNTSGEEGFPCADVTEQQQPCIVSERLLPVADIGARLLHHWIAAVVMIEYVLLERLIPKAMRPASLDSFHPFPLRLMRFFLLFFFDLTRAWAAREKVSLKEVPLNHRHPAFAAHTAMHQSILSVDIFIWTEDDIRRNFLFAHLQIIVKNDHTVSPAFTL